MPGIALGSYVQGTRAEKRGQSGQGLSTGGEMEKFTKSSRCGLGRPEHAIILAAFLLTFSSAALASSSECEVRARGGFAVVAICPPGLPESAWREVGRLACGSRGPCNAWIWDDPGKAPKRAPTFDSPMTDSQADSAVAVWINRSGTLNVCAKSGC